MPTTKFFAELLSRYRSRCGSGVGTGVCALRNLPVFGFDICLGVSHRTLIGADLREVGSVFRIETTGLVTVRRGEDSRKV